MNVNQSQLTAYALDQLDAEETAAVEVLLARSPEAREAVREIRATGELIRQALKRSPQSDRGDSVRAAVEKRLDEAPSVTVGRRTGRRMAALCTTAVCVGLVIVGLSWLPGAWNVVDDSSPEVALSVDGTQIHRRENTERDALGLEVQVDTSSTAVFLGVVAQPADGSTELKFGMYGVELHSPESLAAGTSPAPATGPRVRYRLDAQVNGPAPVAGQPVGAQWNAQGMSGYGREDNGQVGSYGYESEQRGYPGDSGGEHYNSSPRGQNGVEVGRAVKGDPIYTAGKPIYESRLAGVEAAGTHERHYTISKPVWKTQPAPAEQIASGRNLGGVAFGPSGLGQPAATGEHAGQLEKQVAEVRRLTELERKAKSGLETRGESLSTLRQEVEAFRGKIAGTEVNSDERFKLVAKLTDELHAATTEYKALQEQHAHIAAGVAASKERFRALGESAGTEQYDPIVENPFLRTLKWPESTFSIDVDTASYANVRRFLNSGQMPPPNAVRIEEMVNYFRYDYAPPEDEGPDGGPEGEPFSVHTETAECPWNTDNRLLRIALKGREIDPEQRGPSNLVFLLDVSGSMRDDNKLPLVKLAMLMLVDQLTEDDRLAIVTYAASTGVVLESTCGDRHRPIRNAIEALSAGGSTHGSAGIQLAYQQAAEHFVPGGANRVILCTDGDLNVGITDDDELVELITQQATTGVFLTVLGFGTGNLKDAKLEKLADHGNGMYAYVDSIREARRILVEQVTGSLITIAKDVKIQVEFNPARVERYRLVGYENRLMAARDFDNDKKDAGEIGAGHTVTAFYEFVPVDNTADGEPEGPIEPVARRRTLKYQRPTSTELTEAADSDELLTLRLRYKRPEATESVLREFVVKDSDARFGQASADFRFAAAVASFGMMLRHSQHAGQLTYSAVEEFAGGAIGDDPSGFRAEFVDLIHRAAELDPR